MADSYDRYENDHGGGFMMGLLTGTVLGAGLGMLLAPRAGSELRGQLGEQARNLANTASEQYRRATDSAGGWADKGRDLVNQARDAVNRGAEETRGYAGATTGGSYNEGTSGSTFGSTTGTTGGTTGGTRPTGGGTDFGRS
jgi:gas vesicle protein